MESLNAGGAKSSHSLIRSRTAGIDPLRKFG
jgi:hypothetical protein